MPEDQAEYKSSDGIDVNELNQPTRQREVQILSPESVTQPKSSPKADPWNKSLPEQYQKPDMMHYKNRGL